jgi:hypothetical protein
MELMGLQGVRELRLTCFTSVLLSLELDMPSPFLSGKGGTSQISPRRTSTGEGAGLADDSPFMEVASITKCCVQHCREPNQPGDDEFKVESCDNREKVPEPGVVRGGVLGCLRECL